jgi:hypothetical protein
VGEGANKRAQQIHDGHRELEAGSAVAAVFRLIAWQHREDMPSYGVLF